MLCRIVRHAVLNTTVIQRIRLRRRLSVLQGTTVPVALLDLTPQTVSLEIYVLTTTYVRLGLLCLLHVQQDTTLTMKVCPHVFCALLDFCASQVLLPLIVHRVSEQNEITIIYKVNYFTVLYNICHALFD